MNKKREKLIINEYDKVRNKLVVENENALLTQRNNMVHTYVHIYIYKMIEKPPEQSVRQRIKLYDYELFKVQKHFWRDLLVTTGCGSSSDGILSSNTGG